MGELEMNKIKEAFITTLFVVKWTLWFDALSEPNEIDRAILFLLFKKNPNRPTGEWTIRDIENKTNNNFNKIHESIYVKLRPKGFIIAERKKGEGNSIFLKLTELGEKFIYDIMQKYPDYVEKTIKDFEQKQEKKPEIKFP